MAHCYWLLSCTIDILCSAYSLTHSLTDPCCCSVLCCGSCDCDMYRYESHRLPRRQRVSVDRRRSLSVDRVCRWWQYYAAALVSGHFISCRILSCLLTSSSSVDFVMPQMWLAHAFYLFFACHVMVVEEFVYLGSLIHSSTGSTCDISRPSAITCAAMQSLENQIWRSRLTISTKLKLYNTCILPIFLYGSDCWAISKTDTRKIDALGLWCLRLASNGTNLYEMMMYGG